MPNTIYRLSKTSNLILVRNWFDIGISKTHHNDYYKGLFCVTDSSHIKFLEYLVGFLHAPIYAERIFHLIVEMTIKNQSVGLGKEFIDVYIYETVINNGCNYMLCYFRDFNLFGFINRTYIITEVIRNMGNIKRKQFRSILPHLMLIIEECMTNNSHGIELIYMWPETLLLATYINNREFYGLLKVDKFLCYLCETLFACNIPHLFEEIRRYFGIKKNIASYTHVATSGTPYMLTNTGKIRLVNNLFDIGDHKYISSLNINGDLIDYYRGVFCMPPINIRIQFYLLGLCHTGTYIPKIFDMVMKNQYISGEYIDKVGIFIHNNKYIYRLLSKHITNQIGTYSYRAPLFIRMQHMNNKILRLIISIEMPKIVNRIRIDKPEMDGYGLMMRARRLNYLEFDHMPNAADEEGTPSPTIVLLYYILQKANMQYLSKNLISCLKEWMIKHRSVLANLSIY